MLRLSAARTDAQAGLIFVRLGVGLVFFLEGIKKFVFPPIGEPDDS